MVLQIRLPLEAADADMTVVQPHQHGRLRVGEGSSCRMQTARPSRPGSTTSTCRRSGASSISVASTSRMPPFSVSRPSPLRANRAWSRCPSFPNRAAGRPPGHASARTGSRGRRPIPRCRPSELVAVIAQGEGRLQAARQRGGNRAMCADPLGVRQRVQARSAPPSAGPGGAGSPSGKSAGATTSKNRSPNSAWRCAGRNAGETGMAGKSFEPESSQTRARHREKQGAGFARAAPAGMKGRTNRRFPMTLTRHAAKLTHEAAIAWCMRHLWPPPRSVSRR